MSDSPRPRSTVRRLLAYALVPLSAVPFALTAPLVAPSVEQRVHDLRDEPAAPVSPRGGRQLDRRPAAPAPSSRDGR
jgi:hypothetical protein